MKINVPEHMTNTVIKMRKLMSIDCMCGTLHIAICDGNLDSDNLEFCLREWYKLDSRTFENERYKLISQVQKVLEWEILQLLLNMTESERHICYWACNHYECLEP